MAIQDFLGGSTKQDIEKAKLEILELLEKKLKNLAACQNKILSEIEAIGEKLEALEERCASMPAKGAQASAASHSEEYPVFNIDSPATPKSPAKTQSPAAPASFYANLEGPVLLTVGERYKDNAMLIVTPTSQTQANVEFNTLCIPNFVGSDPRSLMNSFDCDIQNKDVKNIVPLSTTTAHFANGAWLIDGKISLKII
ncbi:MAG: hypothetical protein NC102_07375 [Clostridium sp.]|nr:hypothetical protein [Clostridium sp.]